VKRAVAEHRPKIVFLTSPNNPDGSVLSSEELLEILGLPVLVVLDEAYIEFSEEASKMAWVATHPNLIVLRTFSKCAALAGLRCGLLAAAAAAAAGGGGGGWCCPGLLCVCVWQGCGGGYETSPSVWVCW
jgi:histidinol-phosphate aminotransferase